MISWDLLTMRCKGTFMLFLFFVSNFIVVENEGAFKVSLINSPYCTILTDFESDLNYNETDFPHKAISMIKFCFCFVEKEKL